MQHANEACLDDRYHGSRGGRMVGGVVGAPRVCRGVRRQQAGELQGDDHQDGVGQPAHLAARRREEPRRHDGELGDRSRHAERAVPPRLHQGHAAARNRDRDRRIPVEGRQPSRQRPRPDLPGRAQVVSRLLRHRRSLRADARGRGQDATELARNRSTARGSEFDGIGMSPLAFFEQLADTPWSVALHESEIAYSIIESIHVWSLVLFFGLGHRVRPAPARLGLPEGAGIGILPAPAALDHRSASC